MIERADDTSDSHPPETEAAHSGLVPQLGMIVRALLASPVAKSLIALNAGTFAVIVATAYGQVWLNRWNQPFYDALTRR
ncbi:MAG: ABC transporter ATP-binding protein/permease, partial [Steroidobacteraceae bacterium]